MVEAVEVVGATVVEASEVVEAEEEIHQGTDQGIHQEILHAVLLGSHQEICHLGILLLLQDTDPVEIHLDIDLQGIAWICGREE